MPDLHHSHNFISHLKAHLHPWAHGNKFKYVNAVYYPSWQVYCGETPSSLKLSVASHVFYAFLQPHEDGTIHQLDGYADTQIRVDGETGCLNAFKKLKTDYPHLKVMVSIGGKSGSSGFPLLAAHEGSRRTFASLARDLVDKYGFDGIDVNWEQPSSHQQGEHYLQLLATIREYFPLPQFLVTTALPVDEMCLRNIDLAAVSTYCDFINLMGYDFAGSWTELSGHQAQLKSPSTTPAWSVDNGTRYLLSHGVPAKKIVLGIPMYGRSFLGATGPDQRVSGHGGENGIFEYKDLPRPGSHETVDLQLCAAFCVGGDGGFVSYDNPETVEMKAKYVKEKKLGGLFYWAGTFDAEAPRSLVQTGYKSLNC
ncbi:glycoside hydrolase [Aspergillus coremiiformis]|uniref:chitinase n=1 Tax=Aspergillus coremiiformis TaxID=138285 RepID=A0A5N6ZGD9_9EURO|nr:glycoside hydrolase [Aspergillus coremiiformis]